MKLTLLRSCALIAAITMGTWARADTVSGGFLGAGINGWGTITVGPDLVPGDPAGALAITNISGTFSDANIGLSNEQITGLVLIDPGPSQGPPFPNSLTLLSVSTPTGPSAISYDNLYYPGGSPVVCTDYFASGGVLDIFGVLFQLANGDFVDLWSNGTGAGYPPLSYGAAVLTATSTPGAYNQIDYVAGGIQSVPEPASLSLLASGLLGAIAYRFRIATRRPKAAREI